MLEGRRSWFRVTDVDETLQARRRALDLHPSGPLHGRGELPVTGAAAEIEQQVMEQEATLSGLLESQRLEHERRSLRVAVRSMELADRATHDRARIRAPRGAFATAVLHELLEDGLGPAERGED